MFGPHLMVDAYGCNRAKLEDFDLVASILDVFLKDLGMTKGAPPYVFPYSDEIREDCGISGVVFIAEGGHMSIHTFPEQDSLCLDIFAGRQFDVEYATEYIVKKFQATRHEKQVVTRGHERPRTDPPPGVS